MSRTRAPKRSARLAQLEELNLFTAEFITDAAMAFLRGNTNLRVLNLRGTDVTDTSLEYVARLDQPASLDISFTQITDVGLEHLASLSQLEELNLGGMKISGVGAPRAEVPAESEEAELLRHPAPQRRHVLGAGDDRPRARDHRAARRARRAEHRRRRRARSAAARRSSVRAAGEAECRIAGGTRITDVGVAKLAKLKKLRYLDLSGSVVTAGALKTLAALAESAAAEPVERRRASTMRPRPDSRRSEPSRASIFRIPAIGDRTLARAGEAAESAARSMSATRRSAPEALAAFKQAAAVEPSCRRETTSRRRVNRSSGQPKLAGRTPNDNESAGFRVPAPRRPGLLRWPARRVCCSVRRACTRIPVVEAQAPAPSFRATRCIPSSRRPIAADAIATTAWRRGHGFISRRTPRAPKTSRRSA